MRSIRINFGRDWALAATAVGLALYYMFVLQWLEARTKRPDRELTTEWDHLAKRSVERQADGTPDLEGLTNRLRVVRTSLAAVEQTLSLARERCWLEAEIRAESENVFQLFEFENARQSRAEALLRLARENGVSLAAPVLDGLPRFSPALENPSLLWPRLSIATHVLKAAISARVETIGSLEANPAAGPIVGPQEVTRDPEEIDVRIQVNGAMPRITAFLASLPIAGKDKPSLFIRHLLIKRQNGTKPEDVTADITIVGLFFTKP